MNDDRLTRLKCLTTSFHGAMNGHDFSDSRLNLQNFPIDCCHHACRLLTMFLFDHGFTDIEKCVGSGPDASAGEHLWIIVEGLIVDITAYQFDETLDEVIVAIDSSWHTPLRGRKRQFGMQREPLGEFVERMKYQYAAFYEQLKQEALRNGMQ